MSRDSGLITTCPWLKPDPACSHSRQVLKALVASLLEVENLNEEYPFRRRRHPRLQRQSHSPSLLPLFLSLTAPSKPQSSCIKM